MYGRRSFNSGNSTYTFVDGHKYWEAINDTGGRDTIRYNGAENATIDLNEGHFSNLSEAIRFHRPNGSSVFSKATVTIGPGVLIENAIGGKGSDVLTGNRVANVLSGGLGNDTLRGYGGNDHLLGGLGNDRLYGGANNDWFVFNTRPGASNHDTVYDYSASHDTIQMDNAVFVRLGAPGALNAAFFHVGPHAADANDYLVYNNGTGGLFYDDNGSAFGHEVLVAAFVNRPALTYHEFTVI
jgi:serralysin